MRIYARYGYGNAEWNGILGRKGGLCYRYVMCFMTSRRLGGVGWSCFRLLLLLSTTLSLKCLKRERERDWWLVVGGSKLVACPMYSHCIVAFIIITGIMNESDTWWRRRYNR